MAGKHAADTSKKPTVIVTVIAAVVVIAVVGVVLFFTLGNKDDNKNTDSTTAATTTAATDTKSDGASASQQTVPQPDYEETQASSTEESTQSSKIALPDESSGSGEGTYIEATYYPTKAVDADSDQEVSLREVFGTAYSGGYIVFKEDGTFFDAMTSYSANSGSYVVRDGKLVATYSNDKNMDITVNSWNGTTPTEFVVNYGGYDVYFN